MKIIGFTGPMGSGKSTAIQYLKEIANTSVINVKFAQPLYDVQEYIYERIESVYKRPESFIKDRKLLQWLGSEWGRDTISQSLWVDLWRNEVDAKFASHPLCIITSDDVRFDNEVETLVNMGGYLIKIRVDSTEDRNVVRNGFAAHTSEAGIDDGKCHFMIQNNGTIEEFKSSLRPVFKSILSND